MQIGLIGLPPDELKAFYDLCSEREANPSLFYVYSAHAATAQSPRVVYIEYLPTKQQQAYLAESEQDWLESFATDLVDGYFEGNLRRRKSRRSP